MREWLKKAFAIEPAGPLVPTADEARLVERLAAEIVRRGLTSPALAFLEMSHPLNFVASQFLVFAAPLARLIFDPAGYNTLTALLERRGSVEYVCTRIEELAAEAQRRRSVGSPPPSSPPSA